MAGRHVVLGTGSLGSAVARRLRERGDEVRMVSRSGRAPLAPEGVEVVAADVTDPAAIGPACEGAAVVYFTAAPPYTDWPALLPPMQQGAVDAAARAGAVLVTAENVYPYGAVDGPMTEDTPLNPCSKKGEVRAKLNEALLAAHQAGTVKAVGVRAPDYYGPGATATTIYGERVFYPALAGGTAEIFGDPEALHTFAYVDDFARALVTVGGAEEALGRMWHAPCPAALKQRELVEQIYAAAGHPTKFRAMPGFLLTVLAWFMPIMRELKEMNYQWTADYDFRWDAYREAFGDDFVTHEDGVAKTLEWFKANPQT